MDINKEDQIIDIVRAWQESHFEGTILFSSSHLLKNWEDRLLNSLEYLGGVHLALFAGMIESVTQTRAELRHIDRIDQLLLIWGIIRRHIDQYPAFAANNPWYLTGLAKSFSSVVRELKQAGAFEKEILGKAGFNENIIYLMDEYQMFLEKLGICDPEDALNEFNQMLSRGKVPEYLKRVITIGFNEFTPGQQRTIQLFEEQGTVTHFTSESYEEDKSIPALINSIRGNGIEVYGLTGSDREWEVRGIARTIRQTLDKGERPENIALVLRNYQQYRPYIKNIFAEYHLFWSDRSSFAWNKLPSFTSLSLWLRLFCGAAGPKDIWHIFNQYFTGTQGLLLDQWLTEDFKSSGKEKSLKQWSQWLRKHAANASETLADKMTFLADLFQKDITVLPLAEYWELGLNWLNIMKETDCHTETSINHQDEQILLLKRADFDLIQAWEHWMHLTESLGWNDMMLDPETFLSLIELLCSEQETSLLTSNQEGIIVSTPSEVRNSEFSTIFLAGLVEGEFPRVPRRSNQISEDNLDKLRFMGYSLKTAEEYNKGEAQAFFNLLKTAKKSIYLSCPVSETEGKKLSPSPFITEIRKLLSPQSNIWPHFTPSQRLSLDAISPLENMLKALSKRSIQYNGLDSETIASIRAEAKRRAGEALYTGNPGATSEIVSRLLLKFNDQYPFSTSAMKEYAHCPFGFFCKRVLRIEPVETPGPLPTPTELGSLYHDILRKFFENHRNEPLSLDQSEEYIGELMMIASEFFTEELEAIKGEEDLFALRLLQIESIKENLRYFLAEELRWQEKIKWRYLPCEFEFSFGGAEDDVQLILSDGKEKIRFVGRIDRIDLRSDAKSFIIFDYKTGHIPSHNDIINGLDLQMPVYIMAAENYFEKAKAAAAGYCSLKKHERVSGLWRKSWSQECGVSLRNAKEDNDWSALMDSSKKYLIQYGRSIRNGDFRPSLGQCANYCSYSAVCRRAFTGGLEDETE